MKRRSPSLLLTVLHEMGKVWPLPCLVGCPEGGDLFRFSAGYPLACFLGAGLGSSIRYAGDIAEARCKPNGLDAIRFL